MPPPLVGPQYSPHLEEIADSRPGPLLGPIISGFIAPVDWRWSFWIALILAGFTWPMLLTMPETYGMSRSLILWVLGMSRSTVGPSAADRLAGPIILKSRARKMRKETGDANIFAPIELEKKGMKQLLVVVLTRPVRMFLFEAIVLSSCLYLSFAYGIFYSQYTHLSPIVFLTKSSVQCTSKPTQSYLRASMDSMPVKKA